MRPTLEIIAREAEGEKRERERGGGSIAAATEGRGRNEYSFVQRKGGWARLDVQTEIQFIFLDWYTGKPGRLCPSRLVSMTMAESSSSQPLVLGLFCFPARFVIHCPAGQTRIVIYGPRLINFSLIFSRIAISRNCPRQAQPFAADARFTTILQSFPLSSPVQKFCPCESRTTQRAKNFSQKHSVSGYSSSHDRCGIKSARRGSGRDIPSLGISVGERGTFLRFD